MELVFIGLSRRYNKTIDLDIEFNMTLGRKYLVGHFRPGLYLLDDDEGLTITLSKDCFMSVEDWRVNRIDLILNG